MKTETIINFLVQKIFMHYVLPKEFLSDNDTKLLANIIEYNLQKLHT